MSTEKNNNEIETLNKLDYNAKPIEINDFMPKLSLIHLLVSSLVIYGDYLLYSFLENDKIDFTHLFIYFIFNYCTTKYIFFINKD